MSKFAFISRHEPTQEQHELAKAQNIQLVHIGDADAFTVDKSFVEEKGSFKGKGVVVVHPAAALRLVAEGFIVGIFKNENRAPVGEKPTFLATEFHLYDLKGEF